MIAAVSRLAPAAAKFARQIVPPVIATLIAAGLISAYNRAFSGHLRFFLQPAILISTILYVQTSDTY